MFSSEYCDIFKNSLFYTTPPVTASKHISRQCSTFLFQCFSNSTLFTAEYREALKCSTTLHCVKYRNFTKFHGANRPKLCGNYAFPQNFHTQKLGQITVFYAVLDLNKLKRCTLTFQRR